MQVKKKKGRGLLGMGTWASLYAEIKPTLYRDSITCLNAPPTDSLEPGTLSKDIWRKGKLVGLEGEGSISHGEVYHCGAHAALRPADRSSAWLLRFPMD